jgi:osmotically-inducible protein OsmY
MADDGAAERAQLLARIRDALVRSEGELGLDVIVDVGVVTLRGVVQTHERSMRIEALSRHMSRGFSVVNEIAVVPPESSAAPETLP